MAGFTGNYPGTAGTSFLNGVSTLDRWTTTVSVNANGGLTATDGTIFYTGFMVPQLVPASLVSIVVTTAGTSQTGAFAGIYQLDGSGNGTQLAVSSSTTGLVSATGLRSAGLGSVAMLSPGTPYVFGFLSVGPGSGNAVVAGMVAGMFNNLSNLSNKAPFMARTGGTGQTVLPASFLFSSLTLTTAAIYAELTNQ